MSADAMLAQDHIDRTAAPLGPARLAVAWQNPESRTIYPVGLLTWNGAQYGFAYLERAKSEEGFRPFLGFPEFGRHYQSTSLFSLFAQRIMSPNRPDFGRYLDSLDLQSSATPWEVLSRSEGRREGDSVLVFPEPFVARDGMSTSKILVHGIRHRQRVDMRVSASLDALSKGAQLRLIRESDNEVNPRAVLVADSGEVGLGYFPDLLLGYLDQLRESGDVSIVVARNNGPKAPPHLRLLVEISGFAGSGFEPFSGQKWLLSQTSV